MTRQERNISVALSQRGQLDTRDRETVEEIVSEQARRHGLVEIPTRRSEHAYLHTDGAAPTDPAQLAPVDDS
jgi:hypothetical protein